MYARSTVTLYSMLQVSLDCQLLTAPSVFSNVYFLNQRPLIEIGAVIVIWYISTHCITDIDITITPFRDVTYMCLVYSRYVTLIDQHESQDKKSYRLTLEGVFITCVCIKDICWVDNTDTIFSVLCCDLFVFVLCTQCCKCLWIVNYWLPLRFSLTFIFSIKDL
jgi:hypothetical protein